MSLGRWLDRCQQNSLNVVFDDRFKAAALVKLKPKEWTAYRAAVADAGGGHESAPGWQGPLYSSLAMVWP